MSNATHRSPIPLYLQIAETMRERIRKGVWQLDDVIPTLEELALEFGVARVTVRQAVQLLVQEGLLMPQRGKGTFVSAAPVQRHAVTLHTSLADLARSYEGTTPLMLSIDEHSAAPALAAGACLADEGYVRMRRVHSIEGSPYCLIDLYLRRSLFEKAPQAYRQQAVIPLLLQQKASISEAYQTMTVGQADSELAYLLRLPADSPVVHVERVFKDGEGVVSYFAHATYRGDWVQWRVDLVA